MICGSRTFGDDSEQHWVCNSVKNVTGKKINVFAFYSSWSGFKGSGNVSNKNGDNETLQKWGVYIIESYKKGGIYISEKYAYGLKGMRHKMQTCMWLKNNRKLSGFFYSNFFILSSVFRPIDIID